MDLPLQRGASARGVLLSSHCCIQNVMPVQLEIFWIGIWSPQKINIWEALQTLRKLYSVQAKLAAPVM